MAKAPKPGGAGTTGGEEKIDAAKKRIIMRLKTDEGEVVERSFRPGMVPFREQLLVYKETGMSFESFFPDGEMQVGMAMLKVWWWLGCRAQNPMCTLDQAAAMWPPHIDENTFEVIDDDGEPEVEDPEA